MSEFKVEISKETFSQATRPYIVSVTHNGHQWSTISFTDFEEMREARDAIAEYIRERNEG